MTSEPCPNCDYTSDKWCSRSHLLDETPPRRTMPEFITQTEFEAGMRAMGIDTKGAGLISMEFRLVGFDSRLIVKRNVRDSAGAIVGTEVTVEIPLKRGA